MSTSLYRIGTYCNDSISKIENYDKALADNFKGWVCHHRLEIHEDYQNSYKEMKLMNLYYNRPPEELIFLRTEEHLRIHRVGVKFTEEWKNRISRSNKGRKFTDEHRSKLSKARKEYLARKRGEVV